MPMTWTRTLFCPAHGALHLWPTESPLLILTVSLTEYRVTKHKVEAMQWREEKDNKRQPVCLTLTPRCPKGDLLRSTQAKSTYAPCIVTTCSQRKGHGGTTGSKCMRFLSQHRVYHGLTTGFCIDSHDSPLLQSRLCLRLIPRCLWSLAGRGPWPVMALRALHPLLGSPLVCPSIFCPCPAIFWLK